MKRPLEQAGSDRSAKALPNSKAIVVNIAFKPKEINEEEKFQMLQESVQCIQQNRHTQHSFEQLYQAVKTLCENKKSERLFGMIYQLMNQQAADAVANRGLKSSDPLQYLASLNGIWVDYCRKISMIRQVFLYLDRTYVKSSRDVKSIYDLGAQLFQVNYREAGRIEQKTCEYILHFILHHRDGQHINVPLVTDSVKMVIDLQLYDTSLQPSLLAETQSYYRDEGNHSIQSLLISDYLIHCEKRIREESERIKTIFSSLSRKEIMDIVDTNLITNHCSAILQGFASLLTQTRFEDISRIYTLFVRIQKLDLLKQSFSSYIKTFGTGMVQDASRDSSLVQELLDFKDKMDSITKECFRSSDMFVNAIKDSFEHFINVKQNKTAELIAKFIDSKLRSGNKESSDNEMEVLMDKVLILFRYIQGKDIFEAFYKKDLGKRLLLEKSASTELEKSMIAKLKIECGSSFTMKLEGMFKDIELSKDIMENFLSSRAAATLGKNVDMYVHVISSAYWITEPPASVVIPRELAPYQEAFVDYYKSAHAGRQLQWQHGIGHCVVKGHFQKEVKEFTLSFFQTCVLLLFNVHQQMTYDEILEATHIDGKELPRILQSLACGKVRVLTKEQKGPDVKSGDIFAVNTNFSHKLYKIKINSIQLKETPEENQATNEKVAQDRQYQIDAAIVRIMKTRKVLNYNLLFAELISQVKFPITTLDAKKRIESLIEREYLERDKADTTVYHYLA